MGRDETNGCLSSRIVDADEADGILSNYEKAHPRLARFFMPRMYPGYDFTDESRRTLAATGTIVAFSRVDSVNDQDRLVWLA